MNSKWCLQELPINTKCRQGANPWAAAGSAAETSSSSSLNVIDVLMKFRTQCSCLSLFSRACSGSFVLVSLYVRTWHGVCLTWVPAWSVFDMAWRVFDMGACINQTAEPARVEGFKQIFERLRQ